jgi:hypothetical protein
MNGEKGNRKQREFYDHDKQEIGQETEGRKKKDKHMRRRRR